MTSRVVVIGDALIDELIDPSGSTCVPGGSALNVAVGLAVLGIPAILIGMVGEDADGETIREYLRSWDVQLIATRSARGTGRAVSDRRDGEPTYRFNEASRERRIDFDAPAIQAIREADLVAVSGFPFDRSDQVEGLSAALTGSAALLAIDPNPRSGLLHDVQLFRHNLERMAGSATLVKLGDDDAELLHWRPLGPVAEGYLGIGTQVVLATAGPQGASILGADIAENRPIVTDARPVIDTMGAGDATFAVALAALATDGATTDWGAVLDQAMAVASETIRHPGALLRLAASEPR